MSGDATSPPPAPRRRDKFAAMQSPPPMAAADGAACISAEALSATAEAEAPEPSHASKRRVVEAARVWNDLDQAEAATLRLLELARRTAAALARADELDGDRDGIPADAFRATLQEVHGRLAPHAALVRAYRPPEGPDPAYLARADRGVAREKRSILRAWGRMLEQKQRQEEEVATMTEANSAPEDQTEQAGAVRKPQPVGSKRKRRG